MLSNSCVLCVNLKSIKSDDTAFSVVQRCYNVYTMSVLTSVGVVKAAELGVNFFCTGVCCQTISVCDVHCPYPYTMVQTRQSKPTKTLCVNSVLCTYPTPAPHPRDTGSVIHPASAHIHWAHHNRMLSSA